MNRRSPQIYNYILPNHTIVAKTARDRQQNGQTSTDSKRGSHLEISQHTVVFPPTLTTEVAQQSFICMHNVVYLGVVQAQLRPANLLAIHGRAQHPLVPNARRIICCQSDQSPCSFVPTCSGHAHDIGLRHAPHQSWISSSHSLSSLPLRDVPSMFPNTAVFISLLQYYTVINSLSANHPYLQTLHS